MTSTAGTIFEGYRLLRKLGEGWLGTVHVAQSLDDAQSQALRVLRPELTTQAQVMTQFRRLFEKWQRLNHPRILKPAQLVEHEQYVLYTMPLAASGSVRHLQLAHARDGQFIDLLVAIDLVRQAAEAIAYAHNHNLIHGNLKPENLLLTPAKAILGRQAYGVLVSDFGVAELQAFTHGIHDRQIISAPAYMAPEQFKGNRTDLRSDIYSLGVILYELLTNLLPFEAKDFTEAADKHLHVAPIPPGQVRVEIPTSVEEIVLTCMAKSPEYRYRSVAELEEALQDALNELLPRGPKPTVVMPEIPEPPAPRIEPLVDRTPYPRIQVCDQAGHLIRVESIRDTTATLGRAAENTFVLEHAGVSRHHLSLSVRDDQVYVTDLGSTNGTTLQGVPLPVRNEVLWPDGATLRLEPFWLRLQPPQKVVQQARIGVLVKDSSLTLVPGVPLALKVHLANTGRTVDHFRLEVDGVPAEWVQNLYQELQLNPATDAEATLNILVPTDAKYHAQAYPMRVIARSRENPEEIGFTPMTWTVQPFYRTSTTFKPQRRSAWRKTHYQLTLRNDSNTALTYHPTIEDDEGEVKLQSPWEQINLPSAGSNLSNLIPLRAIFINTMMRLREGIGKVQVSGLPQELVLKPGEEYNQRLDVKMPIRWIAAPRQRRLIFQPNANIESNTPSTLSLQHLPLVPLWALPLLLMAGLGFGYWMLLPPKVIVSVEPNKIQPGQPFNMLFQTENTVQLEVKPFGKTVYNTKAPLLIPKGVQDTTQVQIIAHGRIKTTEQMVTVAVTHPKPVVNAFSVYPQNITAGQTATVKWDVGGVKEVQLEPFGTVPAKGERKFPVTEDTAFKLVAQNNGGTIEQEERVKLLPAEVQLFDVNPPQADVGQKVKVRWRVLNGRNVQLDPGGTVAPSGQMDWVVRGDQTFTLKVQGGTEPIVVSKTLNVYDPQIEVFSVTPTNAKVGDTVTVRWKVNHATAVNLTPFGSVEDKGEQTYRLTGQNTMFTLTAGNGVTSIDKQIAVTATVAAPQITALTLQPTNTLPNHPVTLNWATQNAISTELAGLPQGTLTLAPNGSTSFNAPEVSTPLTFTAKGADGSVDSRTVQLLVKAPPQPAPVPSNAGVTSSAPTPAAVTKPEPVIKRFEANRTSIQQGQSVQLRWQASGVEEVKIFPGGTQEPPSSSTLVKPQETTTYVLIAGSQRREITVQVTPKPKTVTQAPINPQPKPPVSGSTDNIPVKPVPNNPAPITPQVLSFKTRNSTIQAGSGTALTWQTRGLKNVTITPPGTQLSANGTLNVKPAQTTTYTLQAGTLRRQVTVTVKPKPVPATPVQIVSFTSNRAQPIHPGESALLTWRVNGVKQAKLSPLNITVNASGQRRVTPNKTTTYVLSAGSVTRAVTVTVQPRTGTGYVPPITGSKPSGFGQTRPSTSNTPKQTPTQASQGQANTNAGQAPATQGSPSPFGKDVKPPVVRYFTASNMQVAKGTKVTLRWAVDNSDSVYISLVGHVEPTGSVERIIHRTTTFTIDARNDRGKQYDKQSITIRVTNGADGEASTE